MSASTVLSVHKEEGRTTLTMTRAESRNALSSELATALGDAVLAACTDADCRYIVIRGRGGHFSAGTDLKERRNLDADGKWAQSRTLWRLVQALTSSPKPIVALIEGYCLGGGFETALACDLRLASAGARFGFPEMTLGAYPGGGAGVLLPRLIGPAAAKKLLFATSQLSAKDALDLGLVQWVCEDGLLESQLDEVGREIMRRAPLGIAAVKRVLDLGYGLSFDTAAALDMAVRRPLEATEDYQEGIAAFFEKRPPNFKGR